MIITSEFRESDMRKKLKDCQNLRVRDYQHRRDYVEGDKVWFQPLNGNVCIRPALVVTQRGQSVYLHTLGDLKKIAACRVKPFELVNTDESVSKEVMNEDGLEDIDNFYTIDINSFYYNNEHTNKQLNTEENFHKINYTGTNKIEETIWYDAYKNLGENTNAQTLLNVKVYLI